MKGHFWFLLNFFWRSGIEQKNCMGEILIAQKQIQIPSFLFSAVGSFTAIYFKENMNMPYLLEK